MWQQAKAGLFNLWEKLLLIKWVRESQYWIFPVESLSGEGWGSYLPPLCTSGCDMNIATVIWGWCAEVGKILSLVKPHVLTVRAPELFLESTLECVSTLLQQQQKQQTHKSISIALKQSKTKHVC